MGAAFQSYRMPTYQELADLDVKVEQTRARLAGRLRALADAVERAPLERLADASPVVAGTVDQLVRHAPRLLGVYLNLPTPEPGDEGLATGSVDPRFVMRDAATKH
jgi:hypothetical protein